MPGPKQKCKAKSNPLNMLLTFLRVNFCCFNLGGIIEKCVFTPK